MSEILIKKVILKAQETPVLDPTLKLDRVLLRFYIISWNNHFFLNY